MLATARSSPVTVVKVQYPQRIEWLVFSFCAARIPVAALLNGFYVLLLLLLHC